MLLVTGLLLALVAGLISALLPTAGAADLDDRKAEVQQRLKQADRHLGESSSELAEATRALLRSQAALTAARERLAATQADLTAAEERDAAMQERLEAAEARLVRARAALEQGRQDVAEQEGELRRVVVASYQQGDPELLGLSMVLTTQDPAQLTGQMNTNSTVANVEAAVLDQVEAARVMLAVREEETEQVQVEVEARRTEAAANLVEKTRLEEAARVATAEVADLVGARRSARATAVAAKQADLRELSRLQAERDRIERLILARAAATKRAQARAAGSSDGFLDLPVSGWMSSDYGWRTHPIWGYRSFHDGVDFGAGCGAPVRAAAPGRVLSTYFQTAYGNRVIIDHGVQRGVGVATISNHLSSFAVSAGERVERGEVVGYVGDTGWSTGCHLHYTVLNNGTAVNPLNWF
ncbi:peptidoglycan DD-metalloendopeptidase family protein [Nocardioides sp. HDW12B]|uniref:M23 family metallopeptidase n=1 Tax=Nocardioides sp. HDW12B TaxID=2714939 RepID=UPI00140D7CE0|nr:M23 family metallopeptidase [Nocardioides sp. HDW12B]QIK65635.1 peptidoglycan DD-metalloendopeptidase family protein [Nocardioides sp. HDW12B]